MLVVSLASAVSAADLHKLFRPGPLPVTHFADCEWDGQVIEFIVWNEILRQSRGQLHVFLPFTDRGIDGVLHDPTTGKFVPIQVKGRSQTHNGEIILMMHGQELQDPNVQIVLLPFDKVTVQAKNTVVIVSVKRFLELSGPATNEGSDLWRRVYVPINPKRTSPWKELTFDLTQLAERLVGRKIGINDKLLIGQDPDSHLKTDDTHEAGVCGEAELLRRCFDNPNLNVFHAFPDNEFVEYVVHRVDTGMMMGLQVKAGRQIDHRNEVLAFIPQRTFVVHKSSWLVFFAEDKDGVIRPTCLLVPSSKLEQVATLNRDRGMWVIKFAPNLPEPAKTNPYRVLVSELANKLASLLG